MFQNGVHWFVTNIPCSGGGLSQSITIHPEGWRTFRDMARALSRHRIATWRRLLSLWEPGIRISGWQNPSRDFPIPDSRDGRGATHRYRYITGSRGRQAGVKANKRSASIYRLRGLNGRRHRRRHPRCLHTFSQRQRLGCRGGGLSRDECRATRNMAPHPVPAIGLIKGR